MDIGKSLILGLCIVLFLSSLLASFYINSLNEQISILTLEKQELLHRVAGLENQIKILNETLTKILIRPNNTIPIANWTLVIRTSVSAIIKISCHEVKLNWTQEAGGYCEVDFFSLEQSLFYGIIQTESGERYWNNVIPGKFNLLINIAINHATINIYERES